MSIDTDNTTTQGATSPSVAAHRAAAPDGVGCAILTLSDTRGPNSDASGALIRESLEAAGHRVVDYRIAKDEPTAIREIILAWAERSDVEAILSNGGTGIAARDTTYDAVASLIEQRIDGFGELFRMLSYGEIGAAAMLSRAVAGTVRGRVLIAMPGSTNAVRLALEKLILPELNHLVYEATK